MDRERADNLEMIQKMEQLIGFLRGDYVRLGHPNEDGDRQLRALILAIESVCGVITGDKSEDGLPAAVRVIETAIRVRGWLWDVLTEHRESSCREAVELCASILAYIRQKWKRVWISEGDERYADLLAVMWKDLELRGKFGEVVRVLEEIQEIIKQTPKKEKSSLGLRALAVLINTAWDPILELYEQLPDADLFMYDRIDGLVIDPEYIKERRTLDDTCTQLKHLFVQVYEILRTRWVESISYWWHELCRLMKKYFGIVLQESQNAETNSVEALLIQLKQCGEYEFCDFRSCRWGPQLCEHGWHLDL